MNSLIPYFGLHEFGNMAHLPKQKSMFASTGKAEPTLREMSGNPFAKSNGRSSNGRFSAATRVGTQLTTVRLSFAKRFHLVSRSGNLLFSRTRAQVKVERVAQDLPMVGGAVTRGVAPRRCS